MSGTRPARSTSSSGATPKWTPGRMFRGLSIHSTNSQQSSGTTGLSEREHYAVDHAFVDTACIMVPTRIEDFDPAELADFEDRLAAGIDYPILHCFLNLGKSLKIWSESTEIDNIRWVVKTDNDLRHRLSVCLRVLAASETHSFVLNETGFRRGENASGSNLSSTSVSSSPLHPDAPLSPLQQSILELTKFPSKVSALVGATGTIFEPRLRFLALCAQLDLTQDPVERNSLSRKIVLAYTDLAQEPVPNGDLEMARSKVARDLAKEEKVARAVKEMRGAKLMTKEVLE